jgi:hypothetical protein
MPQAAANGTNISSYLKLSRLGKSIRCRDIRIRGFANACDARGRPPEVVAGRKKAPQQMSAIVSELHFDMFTPKVRNCTGLKVEQLWSRALDCDEYHALNK